MSMVDFAREELRAAGMFDEDPDYGGMVGGAVMQLMEAFAKQGHSGGSAEMAADLFGKLVRYQPLTPLTYAAEEFFQPDESYPMWQNRRKPTVFSTHPGISWYDLDEPGRPVHLVGDVLDSSHADPRAEVAAPPEDAPQAAGGEGAPAAETGDR